MTGSVLFIPGPRESEGQISRNRGRGQKSSNTVKMSKKKKCSIAEFLLTDSKKAPEKHGDVHFAEFLANKIR